MNCHQIQDLLPLYVVDELGDDDLKKVSTHLEKCGKCQNSLTEFRQADRVFKSVTLPLVPSSFSVNWEKELSDYNPRTILASKSNSAVKMRLLAAFFTVVMVLSGSYYVFYGSQKEEGNSQLNNTIATDIGRPVVIKLSIKSEKEQNISFTIKLDDGMRFIGSGLKSENQLVMSWDQLLNQGKIEMLIPVRATKQGSSKVVVIVKNLSGKVEKSLNFSVNNKVVASKSQPILATIIL
jgi:Putative zinc-finger